jgi:hypothetical protein
VPVKIEGIVSWLKNEHQLPDGVISLGDCFSSLSGESIDFGSSPEELTARTGRHLGERGSSTFFALAVTSSLGRTDFLRVPAL